MTTACAWCLDPGCSGRPCRHTEALYAPPSAGLWKPPAAACLVCRRPYVSTRAARASAWTVGDEERANRSPVEASEGQDTKRAVQESASPGRYRETCFTGVR